MSGDLSTFSRAKDWLIGLLVAAVLALLGGAVRANDNRITALEVRVQERGPVLEDHSARLARLESLSSETARRLERIEAKLDSVLGK